MPAGLTAGQSSIPCLQENPLGRIRVPKTVEKFESLIHQHRERITLALILTVIAMYVFSCAKMTLDVMTAQIPTPVVQAAAPPMASTSD
jgi:hypothetical protein